MNDADEKLLREMIEQSGEMWMQTEDRIRPYAMPVIICRVPDRAFYLWRVENCTDGPSSISGLRINGWRVEERPLKMDDAADFFAAFGSHWSYLINATLRGLPIRAFIKNGRARKWHISQKVAPASFGSLTESLEVFQTNLKQASEG